MEKINVAEILKDCPQGMELNCVMHENVYFGKIYDDEDSIYPIRCYMIKDGVRIPISFTKYGEFNTIGIAKCVIYPKGKTTWKGFVSPCKFKNGDVVINKNDYGNWIGIFHNHCCEKDTFSCHCYLRRDGSFSNVSNNHTYLNTRLATEEEKQELFDAIKENGYRWNNETKTLEELPPDKFDINTLVPFKSEVLIRNDKTQKWIPAFWGYKADNGNYVTTFGTCRYCIPYEGNEHLLTTNNDCSDYYKTWEK